jgi:hypothetical protein
MTNAGVRVRRHYNADSRGGGGRGGADLSHGPAWKNHLQEFSHGEHRQTSLRQARVVVALEWVDRVKRDYIGRGPAFLLSSYCSILPPVG